MERADVVIVGGAAMGAATAYFLSQLGHAGRVVVIERDHGFSRSATMLSAASIRQQFSTPASIAMSRFGIGFLRALPERFGREHDPALHESGYLVLADQAGADDLRARHASQTREGADVTLLTPTELRARLPAISDEGLALASLGLSGEGWFDASTFLCALRDGARKGGAELVEAEATGFTLHGNRVAAVETSGGVIACETMVLACGPSSGHMAAMLGRPLDVRPRKRTVFAFRCRDHVGALPLVADPSGVWFRPEGGGFITGYSPKGDAPCASDDFEPDWPLFEAVVWPALARRVPAFEAIKVSSAWAGHYDVHALDHNAVIGGDGEIANLLYCTGFSGHGLQHAPAAGRGVAELIVHGGYRTIDLSPFGPQRLAENRPLLEAGVI